MGHAPEWCVAEGMAERTMLRKAAYVRPSRLGVGLLATVGMFAPAG